MKLTLQVTPQEGEPYTVHTNLFVIIAWERKFKAKASQLATALGVEDLAFLAYESAKQAGVVVPVVFDDFAKQLVSVDVIGEDDANPTEPAPTDTH